MNITSWSKQHLFCFFTVCQTGPTPNFRWVFAWHFMTVLSLIACHMQTLKLGSSWSELKSKFFSQIVLLHDNSQELYRGFRNTLIWLPFLLQPAAQHSEVHQWIHPGVDLHGGPAQKLVGKRPQILTWVFDYCHSHWIKQHLWPVSFTYMLHYLIPGQQ